MLAALSWIAAALVALAALTGRIPPQTDDMPRFLRSPVVQVAIIVVGVLAFCFAPSPRVVLP